MKNKKRLICAIIMIILLVLLCSCAKSAPQKIILFIGDGMGENHIENTALLYGETLNMQTVENAGELTTFSLNSDVTDSAAAGTALATGYKTNNSMLGITFDEGGNEIEVTNLCELARKCNKKIGIVTTADVTDATPAAFSSHVADRNLRDKVAADQIEFAPNVLFGGYHSAYSDELLSSFDGDIVTDSAELSELKRSGCALGLFSANSLGNAVTDDGTPSISDMTQKAIELLENKDGFFLMVEGAYIDKHSHSNNMEMMTKSLHEMDKAIKYSLDYAKKDKNTIVIITADHETGALLPANSKEDVTDDLFTSGNHSSSNVPLYAYGKNAKNFSGVMDNTQLSKKIAALMTSESFGSENEYTK